MGTPDAIRINRVKLGLTQAQLAQDVNVDTRQINRYETGETEPSLAIARRIAGRLRITMDELAGGLSPLNGTWYSAWDNLASDGHIYGGPVELAQQGRHLTIQPLRGQPNNESEDGRLIWSAEVFVDVETLLGGFKIEGTALRRMGLLNLTHRGDVIDGTWVRVAVAGSSTGKVALARTPEEAFGRIQRLRETD